MEDSSRFFYPFWKWGAGVWNRGAIPLWNSDVGFGTPYFADPQMAVLYPPVRIFYYFFSPTWAFTFLIPLHQLWAILGFWFFARGRGFSSWIGLCGCLVFGFSFNAVSLSWATPMLFSYAWIPWIFYGMDGLAQSRKGSFLLLTSALSLQLAAGYPLFFYMTLLTLGISRVLSHATSAWNKPWREELGAGMGAVLMATALNAAWLLPFEEFIPYSNLGNRTDLSESLNWSDLATWLNPFFKGHPLFSSPTSPFSVTVYFAGLPPLVVLVWAILNRKISRSSILLFLLVVVLSLGTTALAGGWFKAFLPGYGLVVRSGYWIPFVIWVLAGLFMESEKELSEMKGVGWIWASFLVYFSALVFGVPWELETFWISLFFTLGAGLAKFFSWNLRRVFLAIAIVFSVGPVIHGIQFTMDKSYYDQPPQACSHISKSGRIYNAPSLEDHFHYVSGNGVMDAYLKLKEAMVSNWPIAFGFREIGFSNALFLKSFINWYYAPYWGPGSPKILDYLDARYVVGWIPCFNGFSPVSAGTAPLWNNLSAISSWRSCQKAVPQNDWKKDFAVMNESSFRFSNTCFVPDMSLVGNYHPRIVSESLDGPNVKIIKAVGKGSALLVSSETAYPGWRALVDGQQVGLTEVNHGFQGLVLEDGQETVKLTYRPTSFRLGFFISLLAFAFLMGIIFRSFGNFYACV